MPVFAQEKDIDMNKKRLLIWMTVCGLAVGMTACKPQEGNETLNGTVTPSAGTPAAEASPTPQGPATPAEGPDRFGIVTEENGLRYIGAITANKNRPDGIKTDSAALAGTEGSDYTDDSEYTYTVATNDLKALSWTPFGTPSDDEFGIRRSLYSVLYDIVPNGQKDGSAVICEMAKELPVDVTADYVGSYGISEGEQGKAWKIRLRDDATWIDETPITAETYVYTFREMLNPRMNNPVAELLTTGDMAIYNAAKYRNIEKAEWIPNSPDGTSLLCAWDAKTADEDGIYTMPDGQRMYFGLAVPYGKLHGNSLRDYFQAGYIPKKTYEALAEQADQAGFMPVTDKTIELLYAFTGSDLWGNETEDELAYYVSFRKEAVVTELESVGIFATDEYEFVLITEQPVPNAAVTMPGILNRVYLVREGLWEKCKKYYDENDNEVSADSENAAYITSDYGTTSEKTASYGPYMLSEYNSKKRMVLERNNSWYGYRDEAHAGQYQTDRYVIRLIEKESSQLEAFLAGEIEQKTLTGEQAAEYAESDYVRQMPKTERMFLAVNTDKTATSQRGTEILTNETFRKALSLAISRGEAAEAVSPFGTPLLGLVSPNSLSDRHAGTYYRETDAGKQAIVGLYDVTVGETGDYGTLNSAYEQMTGYDPELARAQMSKAYDECVADLLYDGSREIELEILFAGDADVCERLGEVLDTALKNACIGTGFEGKLSIRLSSDEEAADVIRQGKTDMILTVREEVPEDLYREPDRACGSEASDRGDFGYGFDADRVPLHFKVNDTDYVATLKSMCMWMAGTADENLRIRSADGKSELAAFAEYDANTRAAFAGILEKAYLGTYTTIPLLYQMTPVLLSQRGRFPLEEYREGIGFGGLRYYTYAYSDEEWKDVCKDIRYLPEPEEDEPEDDGTEDDGTEDDE